MIVADPKPAAKPTPGVQQSTPVAGLGGRTFDEKPRVHKRPLGRPVNPSKFGPVIDGRPEEPKPAA